MGVPDKIITEAALKGPPNGTAQGLPNAYPTPPGDAGVSPQSISDAAKPQGEPVAPAEIFVRVSSDKLRAYFCIRPPKVISKVELDVDFVRKCWLEFGLDTEYLDIDVVNESVQEWLKTHLPVPEKLAAETPFMPIKGDDARLEYLVDPTLKIATTEGNASIDFKSLNLIKPVVSGQALVRKHPANNGAPGVDLYGKPSIPAPGVDKDLPRGLNTEFSSTDPMLLVASVSGFLEKKDGLVGVNECFIVDGSVDYSTGNILYEQSALIKGDVSDGFTVNVGGALEVGGAVGEAKLIIGGDVLIKKGFVGAGTGLITAKGNVSLGFSSNQNIRAHGDILLEKESFNCRLFSRKNISVLGPLVGGQAMAFTEIQCRVAGNEMGTKTELELGIDYILHENKLLLEEKIKELTGHLAKINFKLKSFRETYRSKKKFTSEEAKLMLELRDMHEKIQSKFPELEKRKLAIMEKIRIGYQRDDIRLRVEKKLHAGVSIKIGSECLRIQEDVPGPRLFTYSQGRIKAF